MAEKFPRLEARFTPADAVAKAHAILGRILTAASGAPVSWAWLVFLAALYLVHWAAFYVRYRESVPVRAAWPQRLAWVGVTLLVVTLGAGFGEPFYYFQV